MMICLDLYSFQKTTKNDLKYECDKDVNVKFIKVILNVFASCQYDEKLDKRTM